MVINSTFLTPLKFFRKAKSIFSADTIIELSKNKSCDKQMLNYIYSSLNIRVIPTMLPTICFIPGIIFVVFTFNKSPELIIGLSSFIPPILVLVSLVIASLFINHRTNKFINKISTNADHAAIAYRYLLTKKRNFIYMILFSAFYSSSLCNFGHWVTLSFLLLTTVIFACIPLYKIQLHIMQLQNTSHPLAMLNIINPQYFNRFQQKPGSHLGSKTDADIIIK